TRFSRDWSSDVCSSDLGFGFGLSCLGTLTHPFQFPLEGLLLGTVVACLLVQTFDLLSQPRCVIPLVGDALTAVEFEDPRRDVIRSEERRVGKGCRKRSS